MKQLGSGYWTVFTTCRAALAITFAALAACGSNPRDDVGGGGGDGGGSGGDGGGIASACADASGGRSYVGCEYWAVDLDNAMEVYGPPTAGSCAGYNADAHAVQNLPICYKPGQLIPQLGQAGLCDPPGNTCPSGFTCTTMPQVCVLDAAHAPFAIVVSNPQIEPAVVTLHNAAGPIGSRTVAPGAVETLFPSQLGAADQSVDRSGVQRVAYQVTSDRPIVAYQFNPLDNVGVFSNDGSLLLPRATFGSEYVAMSWPTLSRRTLPGVSAHDYDGFVSVVAWRDGTVVEVTPTAPVRASATQPAIAAGQTVQFTLGAYDVLTLEAQSGDLTGTRVRSADGATFGVFAGHEATIIEPTVRREQPWSGPCCADHLEEMMFPARTWGRRFAVARAAPRGTMERDVVRVLALGANTGVTIQPAPASGGCGVLAAGQHCQFEITTDTEIVTDGPALVGHYLQSAIWQNESVFEGNGDPSLALVAPVEQYRTSYTFLAPSQYASQHAAIIAPAGGGVLLDGVAVSPSAMTPMPGGLVAMRLPIQPGQHVLRCDPGCGLEVMGYDDAVSYLFAGGLDLEEIVE
ncbi:MAG: IgGFc-binding protein [Kofleriaceae bacterium]|nr:IgGFc-binding protein [Kofleriaceae bacterium]